MTERVLMAVQHPQVDAIGHLTGRMIGRRPGYTVDVEQVIEAAACTGTMLEINANPNRRDLSDLHARAAAQAGVRIVVNSDAHGVESFGRVTRYGIATARRAWLTKHNVANTRTWRQFAKLRKRARG
jgi:DNA polymerase (family 10)